MIKSVLLNFFDAETFKLAEEAFFKGFHENGGVYNRFDPVNVALERTILVGGLIGYSIFYFGVKDGIRDTWSEQFKNLMFKTIKTGTVDYVTHANILRSKTKQPTRPTMLSS